MPDTGPSLAAAAAQNAILKSIVASSNAAKKAAAATGTKVAPPKGYIANPPFDRRIQKINDFTSVRTGTIFQRGSMVTDQPINGYYYALNFLYNPTTVNVQHSIDNSLITAQSAQNPNDPSQFVAASLAQQASFSLLFDRTYELWGDEYLNTEVGQRGVQMDVIALYRMVQITAPPSIDKDGTVHGGAVSPGSSPAFFRPRGPMIQTPARLNIGGAMSYFGYINSLNLTYTHWSHSMTPMRCQADISFTLLPDIDGSAKFGNVSADLSRTSFGNFTIGDLSSNPSVTGVGGR